MRCRVTYPDNALVHEYATFEEAMLALGATPSLITFLTTETESVTRPLWIPAMEHAPEGLHYDTKAFAFVDVMPEEQRISSSPSLDDAAKPTSVVRMDFKSEEECRLQRMQHTGETPCHSI
jgi:hypothetical protein